MVIFKASSVSEGKYTGLRYNETVFTVYPSDYLVKEEEALKQIAQPPEMVPPVTPPATPPATPPVTPPDSPPTVLDTRFFMNVRLDNTRVIRDLQRYLDEVIKHISSTDNCNVELSLEVNAETTTGFSQETVRTVSENCRTLNVSNFGFEKEEH